MTRRLALAAVLALCLAQTSRASAGCPPESSELAARIDAHIDRQVRRSRTWNISWGITFGVLAGLQFAAATAEWVPHKDEVTHTAKVSLYFGAGKAALGALARVILPLRAVRPASCTDTDALRALDLTAARQKRTFWLNHAGSLTANAVHVLVLGLAYDAWGEGLTAFALGYPVGLLSIYTQPRGSWKAQRRGDFIVVPGPASLSLAFAF